MHDRTKLYRVQTGHTRVRVGLWTLALTALGSNSAWAEPKRQQALDSYEYIFEAEFLDGDSLSGDGPLLRVRPTTGYVPLIRPRASYVPELLQSVENL